MLVLALSMPLTACHGLLVVNDPNNECDHPEKPVKGDKGYTDEQTGIYITTQGNVIDRCRSLLGHKAGINS